MKPCYNCAASDYGVESGPNGPTIICHVCQTVLVTGGVEVEPPEFDDAHESHGPDDFSDDGEALASAGLGTDEDYGYYGGDDDF